MLPIWQTVTMMKTDLAVDPFSFPLSILPFVRHSTGNSQTVSVASSFEQTSIYGHLELTTHTLHIDAVFFNSHCGVKKVATRRGGKRKEPDADKVENASDIEEDVRCTSLKEAVKFAKRTNLLGIIAEATPLVSTF
jgi:hypothetical protein